MKPPQGIELTASLANNGPAEAGPWIGQSQAPRAVMSVAFSERIRNGRRLGGDLAFFLRMVGG